ncbi:MAG TPA: hypothetical protein VFW96_27445 [Thermomicrobiales bacterium]|nr:hypothetical protein [Thermomicrobiales bacterium]
MVARASRVNWWWTGEGAGPRGLAGLALVVPVLAVGVVGERGGAWALPALAALWMVAAAAGGALTVGVGAAARHGLLAGLVASLSLLVYGWLGPGTPVLFALTVAAGWLGGALGGWWRSRDHAAADRHPRPGRV